MRSVEILIPYTRAARIIRGDLATAEIDDPVLTERCGVLAPYRRGRLTSGRLAQPGQSTGVNSASRCISAV
jgi:hypothetical protein